MTDRFPHKYSSVSGQEEQLLWLCRYTVHLCVCACLSVCVCRGGCLTLDLQNRGVMVENGQNDFVHVLPQTQVDLLLLLQSIYQLRETERQKCIRRAVISRVNNTSVHQQQANLVSGCVVNLGSQALSLGMTGKQVLGLIQTQTEDLSVQVVVLIPQLMILLQKQTENISCEMGFWMKLSAVVVWLTLGTLQYSIKRF